MTTVSITQTIGEPANLYVPPPPPTELSVSAALRYLKLTPGASTVSICDSSANIQKNLATLQSLNGRISAIFASSEASQNLTVSYKDFVADKGVLAKWNVNANHKFDFTDVTVSNANNIWNRDFTNTVTIKDTAINIQNGFDNLNYIVSRDPAKISSINQLNNTALITISTSQFREGTSLLSKINKGVYNLGISNATVEDVVLPDLGTATGTELKLGYNSKVKSISIVDTTDAIDIGLDKLQRVGIKIKSIAQNNTAIDKTLELDASQIKADAFVLGKIITGYQLAAQNAASTQLNNLLSNKKVISIDIVDNAANISKNWNSINSISSAVISSVSVNDGNTAAVKISASQLAVSKSLINRFSPPDANGVARFKLEVSEATASQIVDLMNSDEVTKFDIKDTSENISQHLADLLNADSNDKLNYVKTANKAQLVMDFTDYDKADTKTLLAKVNKGAYNMKLTDVSVNDLKKLTVPNLTDRILFLDKSIEAITLKDDGSVIQSNLDLLNATGNRLKSIEITNTLNNLITLSAKDFINRQTVLNKIEGGYIADLEKASIKQALSFSTNVNINTIDIEDNTQNVSAYWNRLVDMNNQLDQVSITGVAISITANQYELGLATDDAATGVSGIDNYLTSLQGKIAGVSFAVKNASIEQALSLVSGDTNNNPAYISNIEINDNGKNIGENLVQLDNLIDDHIVTKINQIDPRNAIEITHDDMVDYHNVLETIYGQGYRLSVTDVLTDDAVTLAANNKVSSITILDNSTRIAINFDDLTSIGKKLSKIEMTDPEANISLSYSQYFKGTYVLDRINDNYFVSISDAPLYNVSNLANNNHIKSMIVNGTSSMISRTWDVLESIGPKVVGILNTTSFSSIADAIELNINQWLNSSVVLSKFTNDSAKKFSISDAKLSDLEVSSNHDVLHDENVIAVKIRDISDVIDNFNSEDVLTALQNSKVQEISLVDSSVELSLSFSQLNVEENIDVLQKIKGEDFILNITDATVNNALSLINNLNFGNLLPPTLNVKSIHITDAAVEVVNNFDTLKSLTQLSTISLPLDDELLTLTSDRVLSSVPLLSKIDSYLVDITNVSINQLIQLKSIDNRVLDTFEPIIDSPVLPNIQYYYLRDSAANFSNKYDEIISLGPNLKGLYFDSVSHNFDVTYHQWMSSKDTLDSLVYGEAPNTSAPTYKFNIADISANDIVTITSDAKVNSVVVIDTADQIAANWTNLETTFNASPSKMVDMEFSDFLPLKLSVSQAIKNAGNNPSPSSLLDKVDVTNALIIKDTVSNIQAAWDDLSALYGNSSGALGQLTGIELTDSDRIYRSASQVASTNDQALKLIFPTGSVIVT